MSWRLFKITLQCFRTLEPISGMDGIGMDGWLSLGLTMYRAPSVLIKWAMTAMAGDYTLVYIWHAASTGNGG